MELAEDLLQQAREMAQLGAKKPRQANLRRSISTAYYALFHLLVQDAAKRLSPRTPIGLAQQISRAFAHAEMKQVCKSISSQTPVILSTLHPQGFSAEMLLVAKTFVSLQEERHAADYDLTKTYTKGDALNLVDLAQTAFLTWKRMRQTDEANLFCAALLLHRAWSR